MLRTEMDGQLLGIFSSHSNAMPKAPAPTETMPTAPEPVARVAVEADVRHDWGHRESIGRHGAVKLRICRTCGCAENTPAYDGHVWWLAGIGYDEPPPCRNFVA